MYKRIFVYKEFAQLEVKGRVTSYLIWSIYIYQFDHKITHNFWNESFLKHYSQKPFTCWGGDVLDSPTEGTHYVALSIEHDEISIYPAFKALSYITSKITYPWDPDFSLTNSLIISNAYTGKYNRQIISKHVIPLLQPIDDVN